MNPSPLYIVSQGHYLQTVGEEDLPELKQLVKETTGQMVRRVTRFVQLAMIGAARCVGTAGVDAHTGVYFASCRGDTGVTVELLDELVRHKHPPSPLTFVNSVSNAACFYVAKVLGLYGKSNFVTNRYDPLFAALKLAAIDLASSPMPAALVGTVDSCSLPLREHRYRLHVPPEQPLAEASHWFLLTAEVGEREVLATVEAMEYFADRERLIEWLRNHADLANAVLGVGQQLTRDDVEQLAAQPAVMSVFDYCRDEAYYDTPTGNGVARFINERNEERLVHINRDLSGRYTLLMVAANRG